MLALKTLRNRLALRFTFFLNMSSTLIKVLMGIKQAFLQNKSLGCTSTVVILLPTHLKNHDISALENMETFSQ